VPADHLLGLDNRDRIQNRWKLPLQPNEQQPVDIVKSYAAVRSARQDNELLAQDSVFSLESRT
jgi:hypothetical protein